VSEKTLIHAIEQTAGSLAQALADAAFVHEEWLKRTLAQTKSELEAAVDEHARKRESAEAEFDATKLEIIRQAELSVAHGGPPAADWDTPLWRAWQPPEPGKQYPYLRLGDLVDQGSGANTGAAEPARGIRGATGTPNRASTAARANQLLADAKDALRYAEELLHRTASPVRDKELPARSTRGRAPRDALAELERASARAKAAADSLETTAIAVQQLANNTRLPMNLDPHAIDESFHRLVVAVAEAEQWHAAVMRDGAVTPAPEKEQTTSGDRETLRLPALLNFSVGTVVFEAAAEARPVTVRAIQNVLLRELASVSPGNLRFTFLDPVGLGQSVAPLMHLADYDDSLVGGKAWTEPQYIEQRLMDLTEHMETIIQKYLRNQFATIEAYNEQAGEVANLIEHSLCSISPPVSVKKPRGAW
jgi:hypothetical protein